VPDWDNAERRESDEDAAWRDLIARFDAPAADSQQLPWPDREDPDRHNMDRGAEDLSAQDVDDHDDDAGTPPPDQTPVSPGFEDGGALFQTETSTTGTPAVSSWRTAPTPPADPDDEHFVPPPPPPLPKLEPLTKAAWLALFGGPAYLLIATAARWSLPGIAVFCAIAAFVAGVALLVLRLNDSDPPSAGDDDDDGAVV